jgi:hypothetical protein
MGGKMTISIVVFNSLIFFCVLPWKPSLGFVTLPTFQRHIERYTNPILFAKRKKATKKSKRNKQSGGNLCDNSLSNNASHRSSQSDSDLDPIAAPSCSSATQRPPATLAGVVEDHRYEQFFYDDATARQLYHLVDLYERPLLLCNPTLAVLAEKKKSKPSYCLLDRDDRFNFLSGYRPFSLTEPHLITDYEYDAVFVDPPFANVTPQQVARCLRLMAPDHARQQVPLYVAYNSKREDALLSAMNELECPKLERKWQLGYQEGVSMNTQEGIWLYGPENA